MEINLNPNFENKVLIDSFPHELYHWLEENIFDDEYSIDLHKKRFRYVFVAPMEEDDASDYITDGWIITFKNKEDKLKFELAWGELINDQT